MDDTILRRTWAEIDLDALAHNYRQARNLIGSGVKYLGVVKADAYRHGAVQAAAQLERLERTIWRSPVWMRPGSCARGVFWPPS